MAVCLYGVTVAKAKIGSRWPCRRPIIAPFVELWVEQVGV